MKIHLIGRLAILTVCLMALGLFGFVFGESTNNQAVRRLGFILGVLSAILSILPLLASVIYSGVQKIRRLWDGSSK
jgi:succinate-acetate transporter protein